jgi:hypothetical protein
MLFKTDLKTPRPGCGARNRGTKQELGNEAAGYGGHRRFCGAASRQGRHARQEGERAKKVRWPSVQEPYALSNARLRAALWARAQSGSPESADAHAENLPKGACLCAIQSGPLAVGHLRDMH